METLDNRQPFWAISKICLNNWHYIDRKILTLSEGINFFTGHSGSGKSTVIDAIQIVLYANTDGRGFFNKAAADDSDRTLIEYLRGMVNISENNESQYLRNKNFSSTIVIELNRREPMRNSAWALYLTWRQQQMRSTACFSGTEAVCLRMLTGEKRDVFLLWK